MKNLMGLLQSLVSFRKANRFYYIAEELRFEEDIENRKMRYLTSYDRAA